MALTHSTRYSTSQRCPPHYFGQDFAREQRIGNPAALAACCRSFSGWWPLYHYLLLRHLRICNGGPVSGCVFNEIVEYKGCNLAAIRQDKICKQVYCLRRTVQNSIDNSST